MVNFGAIIRKYRERFNITQKELSKDLNVTSTYLSAIENGRKEPSISLLRHVCKALGIPEEVLFWESVEIKGGLNREERKAVEFAKVIVRTYYESLQSYGAKS
jgi:transcriptional regulator with XRE-family HTH domain